MIERWDTPPKARRRLPWPVWKGAAGLAVVLTAAVFLLVNLRHTDSASYSLAGPVERISVAVDAGRVDIVGKARVGALVVRSRHALLGSPSPTTQVLAGGDLRIIALCPGGLVLGCRTDFRIEVPRGAEVVVATASAAVSVQGMTSSVEVRSHSGGLAFRDIGGPTLVAHTGSGTVSARQVAATTLEVDAGGNVDATLTKVADSVSVQTPRGAVDLTLPDAPYRLRTDSAIGVVEVDVTRDQNARRSIDISAPRRDIHVRRAP